ncbi:MAG: hypothetical protein WCS67_01525 [Bacteroidales bacterium]
MSKINKAEGMSATKRVNPGVGDPSGELGKTYDTEEGAGLSREVVPASNAEEVSSVTGASPLPEEPRTINQADNQPEEVTGGAAATAYEASTGNPEQSRLSDLSDDLYKATETSADDRATERSAVEKSYRAPIDYYTELVSNMEKQRDETEVYEKRKAKADRARLVVEGLTRGLSGIANLVGVAHGASNQRADDGPRIDALGYRLRVGDEERMRRMQNIRDRQDALRSDLMRSKQAMGLGLAQYDRQIKNSDASAAQARYNAAISAYDARTGRVKAEADADTKRLSAVAKANTDAYKAETSRLVGNSQIAANNARAKQAASSADLNKTKSRYISGESGGSGAEEFLPYDSPSNPGAKNEIGFKNKSERDAVLSTLADKMRSAKYARTGKRFSEDDASLNDVEFVLKYLNTDDGLEARRELDRILKKKSNVRSMAHEEDSGGSMWDDINNEQGGSDPLDSMFGK